MLGTGTREEVGIALAAATDLDGDGAPDLLISSRGYDSSDGAGVAYAYTDATAGQFSLDASTTRFVGTETDEYSSFALASAGDLDGDGFEDVVIGGYNSAVGGTVYLLRGPFAGTHDLADADGIWTAESVSANAGYSVASAGGVDGDGAPDVLVGAPGQSGPGAAYLLHGPATGTDSLAVADAKFTGTDSIDNTGWSMVGGEDLNGDGFDEIVISAPSADRTGTNDGAAYVFAGPVTGTVAILDAEVEFYAKCGGNMGASLALGDLTGDGLINLVAGGPAWDSSHGAVCVSSGDYSQ